MTALPQEAIRQARDRLDAARRVLVLTGAGMSAESRVPTFRGDGGLWEGFRPEELATPEAFAADPERVWRWYAWRRSLVAGCQPNPGHRALATWLTARRGSALLVTQTVDGLHQAAAREAAAGEAAAGEAAEGGGSGGSGGGEDPVEVLPLHGDLFRVRCTGCRREWEDRSPELGRNGPPECRDCGEVLRPAVVWFGESLVPEIVDRAVEWAGASDAALVVGTSALVQPAASLPLLVRGGGFTPVERNHGHPRAPGCILEVNTQRTPLSARADVHIPGPAGLVLPALLSGAPAPS